MTNLIKPLHWSEKSSTSLAHDPVFITNYELRTTGKYFEGELIYTWKALYIENLLRDNEFTQLLGETHTRDEARALAEAHRARQIHRLLTTLFTPEGLAHLGLPANWTTNA